MLQKADIYMVSEMKADFVRSIFLEPAATAQEALDKALTKQGPGSRILCMPFGGAPLPVLG